MPTSNPSDEQLELVTGRVIELAQALYPYVALDDGAYFDTAGFDEHMAAELAARVEGYCRNADGVAISPLEEQPTPRRMARYLLEMVEWEVLEAPLSSALLAEPKDLEAGGSSAPSHALAAYPTQLIMGFPRKVCMCAAAAVVCTLGVFALALLLNGAPPSARSAAQSLTKGAATQHLGSQHLGHLSGASGRLFRGVKNGTRHERAGKQKNGARTRAAKSKGGATAGDKGSVR